MASILGSARCGQGGNCDMLEFELVRTDDIEVAVLLKVDLFGTETETRRTGSLSKASESRRAARKQLIGMIVM